MRNLKWDPYEPACPTQTQEKGASPSSAQEAKEQVFCLGEERANFLPKQQKQGQEGTAHGPLHGSSADETQSTTSWP